MLAQGSRWTVSHLAGCGWAVAFAWGRGRYPAPQRDPDRLCHCTVCLSPIPEGAGT